MSRADRALDQADRTPGVGPGSRLSGAIHLPESRERVRRPRGQLRQPAQACDQVIQALRDVLAGRAPYRAGPLPRRRRPLPGRHPPTSRRSPERRQWCRSPPRRLPRAAGRRPPGPSRRPERGSPCRRPRHPARRGAERREYGSRSAVLSSDNVGVGAAVGAAIILLNQLASSRSWASGMSTVEGSTKFISLSMTLTRSMATARPSSTGAATRSASKVWDPPSASETTQMPD